MSPFASVAPPRGASPVTDPRFTRYIVSRKSTVLFTLQQKLNLPALGYTLASGFQGARGGGLENDGDDGGLHGWRQRLHRVPGG